MPESTPRVDWAVSGLAQLFDTVITTAGRSRDLTDGECEQFEETGAAAFADGMSLSQLVGTYLGGAAEIWEHVFADADESRMIELGRGLRRVSEQAVGSLAEGYETAQRLSIRAEESLRRSFLDDLLATDNDPAQLADSARGLDLPLFDQAVVAVARSDRGVTDAGPVHRRIRTELQSRAPQRNLWVTAKEGNLVVIALDTTPHQLGVLTTQALEAIGGADWRVSVGSNADGLAAVAASYADALAAFRIAADFELSSPTEFDRILVHRLLAADLNVTQAVLQTVIEPLMDKASSDFMTTLASYIEHGGNMAGVARDLSIGARTVAYRLDRIGQITGYQPGIPEDRFVLELAYRARPLISRRPRSSGA